VELSHWLVGEIDDITTRLRTQVLELVPSSRRRERPGGRSPILWNTFHAARHASLAGRWRPVPRGALLHHAGADRWELRDGRDLIDTHGFDEIRGSASPGRPRSTWTTTSASAEPPTETISPRNGHSRSWPRRWARWACGTEGRRLIVLSGVLASAAPAPPSTLAAGALARAMPQRQKKAAWS
jgi:hypothetical protein